MMEILYLLIIIIVKNKILAFQLELPDDCLDDFEEKINKSKLKLVLTNGKIQG